MTNEKMIKYKGNTSNLLADLSIEMGSAVDLKTSELLLKIFFQRIVQHVSIDRRIELLYLLPNYLKPFCHKSGEIKEYEHLLNAAEFKKTNEALLKVLNKYLPQETILTICASLPLDFFPMESPKKEIFLAA